MSVSVSWFVRFASIRTFRVFVLLLKFCFQFRYFNSFRCVDYFLCYIVAFCLNRFEQSSFVIMMKLVTKLVIALSVAFLVEARVYLSCELAKEFSRNDMERHLIPHWICLVQAESQGNTTKTIDQPNLTTNYGIFQVKEFHKWFIYGFTHMLSCCFQIDWCR